MKKILFILLFFASLARAQVGVNYYYVQYTSPLVLPGDDGLLANLVYPDSTSNCGKVLSVLCGGGYGWITAGGGGLSYWTESQNTAAPNGTVNATRLLVTGGSTNNDVVIQPKGTGALLAQLPDNTATGGNKRGQQAVDLQLSRGAANDVAEGLYAVISGGANNRVVGDRGSISGGSDNLVSANYSVIGGGSNNTCSNGNSSIPGGRYLTLSNIGNFGFLSSTSSANAMTIATDNVATFGNVDLWLANNDNSARGIKFFEPYNTAGAFPNTANFTKIVAGVQSADITYTLPTAAAASNGYFLTSTTGGTMSWSNTPPTLSTIVLSGSINVNVASTQTANYTALATDCVVPGDATSGTITITLPASPLSGQVVWITKMDASINAVQIAPNTGQSIVGIVGNISLPAQGSSNIVVYAGGNKWLSR